MMLKPGSDHEGSHCAKEFDHFYPVGSKLVFNHGETETRFKIKLIPKQKQELDQQIAKGNEGDDGNMPEDDDSDDED